jgi:hypothetical protein
VKRLALRVGLKTDAPPTQDFEQRARSFSPRAHEVRAALRHGWFEHSAHEVMMEEPGKLLVTLVAHARPIAALAGDVAPETPSSSER